MKTNLKRMGIFLLALCLMQSYFYVGVFAQPSNELSITSDEVKVVFNEINGQPEQFILLDNEQVFIGESDGKTIRTVVKENNTQNESMTYSTLLDKSANNQEAVFTYEVLFNDDPVGSFKMKYTVDGHSIMVSYDDVNLIQGYTLIELAPRSIATISEEEGDSSFVYNTPAGRLVPLAEASPDVLGDDGRFSGVPNASVVPVTAFIKGNAVLTMEVLGYTSNTALTVTKDNGGLNRATIGASVQHHIRGSEDTPDLPVGQNEICRIDLVGDYDGNREVNWIDAANVIKEHMPANPAPFFEDQFIYVLKGEAGRKNPSCTFNEAESLMRRVNSLTDGNPQVSYIAGWAEGGHDSAYPNYTKINESLGGEEGFINLRDNVKAYYNGIVSFDDNFDDQYDNKYSQGFFDPQYIARERDGSLEKHKAWNGIDKSHITGMAKYMVDGGPGEARVDYTASHYNLDQTVLIDALSWWSIRHDWDPQAPASAVKNLRDGKFKIIDRYKDMHGIDVASEMLRYPFIGKLGLALDGMYERDTAYGGAGYDIPFASFVLRDSIIYGGSGGLNPNYNDPKGVLFDNTRRHAWLFHDTTDGQITDLYYLNYVPWFKLHDLDILSFQRDNGYVEMTLSNDTTIGINYNNNTWFADYEGKRIWTNNDVTCPVGDDRIAFYSKNGGTLSYPLPEGVSEQDIEAKVLYRDRHDRYPIRVENNEIIIDMKPQIPVMVYLNGNLETNYILNDDSNRVNYQGSWQDFNNRGEGDYGQDVHGTKVNGDTMEFVFQGTGIDVFSERNNDMGDIQISIDGEVVDVVSCYADERLKQQVVYSIRDLNQGEHTLKIEKKSGEWCLIDAVRVFETPVMTTDGLVNDDARNYTYYGEIAVFDQRGDLDFNNDIIGSKDSNAAVEFTFNGTGVTYITEKYKDQGDVEIFIDGQYVDTVSCWSGNRLYQQEIYEINGLPYGEHTMKLMKKTGEWLLIDAMKVYQ